MKISDLSSSVSATAMTAGENITLGQVLTFSPNDGKVYCVTDPAQGEVAQRWRSLLQPASQNAYPAHATSATQTAGASIAQQGASVVAVKLNNGNTVTSWEDASSNVWFAIYDPRGNQVVGKTLIGVGTGTAGYQTMCATSWGGFAVIFQAANTFWALFTFQADGTPAGSFTPSSGALTGAHDVTLIGLDNGNIAYVWTATSNLHYAVFNGSAGVVLADTTFNMNSAGGVTGCACTGGFVLYYWKNGSPAQSCYRIISNAGAQTLGETNSLVTAGNSGNVSAVELAAGGFALACDGIGSGAGLGQGIAVYNAAGTLQGALITTSTTSLAGKPRMCATSGGAAYVARIETATAHVLRVSAAGVNQGDLTPASGVTGQTGLCLAATPDDGFLILGPGATSNTIYTMAYNGGGTVTMPASTLPVNNSLFMTSGFVYPADQYCATPYFSASVLYNAGIQVNSYAYTVRQSQVLGVAQGAAAAGSAVSVQYVGKIGLNVWWQPQQFETIAGAVLHTVGTQASLIDAPQAKASAFVGGVSNSSITFTMPVDGFVALAWSATNGTGGTITLNGATVASSNSAGQSGNSRVYFAAGSSVTVAATANISTAVSYVEA